MPGVGVLEPADDPQQRRLARAATGPSSAVSEPSGTSSETSSRAVKSPKRLDTFDDGDHAVPPPFAAGSSGSEGHEREAHQHGRRRVGAEGVVVVDVAGVDEQRQRLRLARRRRRRRRSARRTRRASGRRSARRRRSRPSGSPGSVIRQNVCQREAPSVDAASSCSLPISCSTGSTSRTTNGSVTKIVASTMPGSEKITGRSAPPSQPSLPQNRISDDADDHRRDRERQVDDRLQDALAREAPAGERERRDEAEDDVQRHDDRDDRSATARSPRSPRASSPTPRTRRSRPRTCGRRSSPAGRARATPR